MKKGFKDYIEKHPILSLLVVACSFGFFVFGIVSYFYSEKFSLLEKEKNIEIAEKNLIINSIKRYDNIEGSYFDTSKFCISKNEIPLQNNYVKFYSKDNFYALKSDNNFIYSPPKDNRHNFFPDEISIHKWVFKKKININGVDNLTDITTNIKVQKTLIMGLEKNLINVLKNADLNKIDENFREIFEFAKENPSDFVEPAKKALEIQINSPFTSSLQRHSIDKFFLAFSNKNFLSELQYLRKRDNVLYIQNLDTYSNVLINLKKYDKYYLREEYFLIRTDKYIYSILIQIPNLDPSYNNKFFNYINKWLNNFQIVND